MKICPSGNSAHEYWGEEKSIKCIQTINVNGKASLTMVPRGVTRRGRKTLRKGKFRVFQERQIVISSETYDSDTLTIPQQMWWENTST